MLGLFQGGESSAREAKRALAREPIVGTRRGKSKPLSSDDDDDEGDRRSRRTRRSDRKGRDDDDDEPQRKRRGGRKRREEPEEEEREESKHSLDEDDDIAVDIDEERRQRRREEEGGEDDLKGDEKEKKEEEDAKKDKPKPVDDTPLTRLEKDKKKQEERAKGYKLGELPQAELKFAYWSGAKMVFYTMWVAAAFFIIQKNYNLPPCITYEYSFCLLNAINNVTCIPPRQAPTPGSNDTSDLPESLQTFGEVCFTKCEQTARDKGTGYIEGGGYGCRLYMNDTNPDTNTTCFDPSLFKSVCQDTKSCPLSSFATTKKAIVYVSIFLLVSSIWEFLILISLCSLADIYHDEMQDLSSINKCLVFIMKLAWYVQQCLYATVWFAALYLIYGFGSEYQSCNGAIDKIENSDFKFFKYARYYLVAIVLLLLFLVVVGMYFRFNVLMRGELYSPSADDQITVPFQLDCRSCREAPGPQTCVTFVNCLKICGTPSIEYCPDVESVQWSCDMFWCFCIGGECWGQAFEKCWKYRHFIGP